jgi:SOS-response transcriptional repressor LexA
MGRGRPAGRRRQMLAYVHSTIDRDGVAPSYGMICRALGIRTRCEVSRMVAAAESAGELRRVGAGKVRRIRLA